MIMTDAMKLRMMQLTRELACTDIRRPINGSTDSARYLNKLVDKVSAAQEFMSQFAKQEVAMVAFRHWQDVFKPDAVMEGWDIRLTMDRFHEWVPVDIQTGRTTDTVVINLMDGGGDHHSAAREFLFAYSPCLFEPMRRLAGRN